MKKLNKRHKVLENSIQAYRGCGCAGCASCVCNCSCPDTSLRSTMYTGGHTTTLSGNYASVYNIAHNRINQ
jgi:putative bacteriocin precursor